MLKLTLLALGDKMPAWVDAAVEQYSKRLQSYVQIQCFTFPIEKRSKSSSPSLYREKEAKKLEQALPHSAYFIALDSQGAQFTSQQLARKLEHLQVNHSHLCFIIGGPDGIEASLLKKMQERWSLSQLTFPHPLARIILLEAIYRAFSILNDHPYHR